VQTSKKYLASLRSNIYNPPKISIAGIKSFNLSFWTMCFLAFIERISVGAFLINSAEIYQQKFNMGLQETGIIIGIPNIITVALSPVVAVYFDRVGKRCYFLIVGFTFLLASHLVFYSMQQCPVTEQCFTSAWPMVLLGVGGTIITLTLYTSFSYVVAEKYYGTAFGILLTFSNAGVLIGCLMVGKVVDESSGLRVMFGTLHLTLLVTSTLGMILSVALCYYDEVHEGVLNAVMRLNDSNFTEVTSQEQDEISEEEKDKVVE